MTRLVSVATLLGRLLSGVHWLTDIVGALLLSGALVSIYQAVVTDEVEAERTGNPMVYM